MSVLTKGTQLFFIDPYDNSVTKVDCITTLTGLSAGRDQIETTCLDSESRTYEPGMPTPGQVQFGINADPSQTSHVRLHELYVAGTKLEWALGWGDGVDPPTVDSAGLFVLPDN